MAARASEASRALKNESERCDPTRRPPWGAGGGIMTSEARKKIKSRAKRVILAVEP
jgi:hypothetical protein